MTNQCTTIIHPLVVLPRPCWRCAVTLSPSPPLNPPSPTSAGRGSLSPVAGRAPSWPGHWSPAHEASPAQPRHPSLHQRGGRARGEGVAGAGGGEEQGGAGRGWGR